MIVLGINEDHNATIGLVKDGVVVYAASEERITRQKNDIGYPWQTIAAALRETSIKPEEIDFVAYSCQSAGAVDLRIKRITRFKIADYVREMHEHWKPILLNKKPSNFYQSLLAEPRFNSSQGVYHDFTFLKYLPEDQWGEALREERIKVVVKQIGIDPRKVLFINHHRCHAYYAYYASTLDRSQRVGVVTADGWGDGENGTVWLAENGRLQKILGTALCNLARFYRYATLLLGMKPYEHEYKVMGLAPYAKDYIAKPVYEIYKKTLVVDGIDFKWQEQPTDMYFYFREKFEGLRFDGIAAGVQKWVEEMLAEWVANIIKQLKVDSLVFSGGLAMNVKANKCISEIPGLRSFFVPPSGGDESTAIGAAYVVSLDNGVEPQPLTHAYLGYAITDEEIKDLFNTNRISDNYIIKEDISNDEIADLLANNKVIARCAGRMEFGARALGNRSILCNPSHYDNIRLVNECIKFRDFWMPFTPSILDYRAPDYLINPRLLSSPYMTLAFDTTPLGRKHLAAAIHPYDFTARPQILDKATNLQYYELIQAFEKRTGIGGILNTSFNLHGEPIVRNAVDAWHTFTESGLDALLLNNTLIIKKIS